MYIAHAHTNVHCASKVWAHCIIVIRTLYTLHFASLYTLHFASLYTVQNASYLLEVENVLEVFYQTLRGFEKTL